MKHFRITEVATGNVVHEYNNDAEIAYEIYPAPEYVTTEVVDDPLPPSPEYTGSWHITKLAFRNRFTQEEKVTIAIASLDDPSAPMQQRGLAASLRTYQDDIAVAQYVDLKMEMTRNGVMALEQFGLIGQGRALEILDTIPTAEELFNG